MARLIALFLFCVYLLTYSGQLHSGDEIAILAATDSLLARGTLDTNLNIWGRYGQPYAAGVPDHYGPSGDLYTKKGIAQSLALAPLFALGNLLPDLGRVHLAALSFCLVTALTGALIYLIGRRLGYGQTSALVAALTFGLTTPAWVYARYALGEPLIGLAVAVWLYSLTRAAGSARPAGWLAAGSLMMSITVATNLTNALLLPLLPVAALVAQRGRLKARDWLALGLPVVLVGLAVAGVNMLRFGSPLDAGQNPELGEGFTTPLAIGVYGLLFSPARGLLTHSPSVLLGVGGWFLLRRRHPGIAWLMAALAAIYVVAYGTYFAWWGGYGWGPRYLLPLAVPASIAALPIFDWMARGTGVTRRVVGAIVVLLLGLSLLIQVLGVLVPFGAYEVELTERYGFDHEAPILYQYGMDVLSDWSLWPALGHARLLLEEGVTDVSWFTPEGVDWAAALPLGAFAALLAVLMVRRAPGRRCTTALVAAALVLTGWAMVRNAAHPLDPAHRRQPALDAIAAEAGPDDGALVFFPEFTRSILNNYPAFPATWGMPPLVTPDLELDAALAAAQARHRQLWVLSWLDALDPNAWAEARLAADHYASGSRRQVDGLWIGQYLMRREVERWQPAGWVFDAGLRLVQFAASPETPAPGESVRIALQWEATRDIAADYVVFVHLVDKPGAVLTSADHTPQNGFRPTWRWQAGDVITDRAALRLPETLASDAAYAIRVGLYEWLTPMDRLRGQTPAGDLTDALTVARFHVRAP